MLEAGLSGRITKFSAMTTQQSTGTRSNHRDASPCIDCGAPTTGAHYLHMTISRLCNNCGEAYDPGLHTRSHGKCPSCERNATANADTHTPRRRDTRQRSLATRTSTSQSQGRRVHHARARQLQRHARVHHRVPLTTVAAQPTSPTSSPSADLTTNKSSVLSGPRSHTQRQTFGRNTRETRGWPSVG